MCDQWFGLGHLKSVSWRFVMMLLFIAIPHRILEIVYMFIDQVTC